jgi:hypothetical protein
VDQGRARAAIDVLASLDSRQSLQIGDTVAAEKDLPPLQATDIWAYEARKYFHGQYTGKPAYRALRRSLEKICQIPDGLGFVLIGDQLQSLLEARISDLTIAR